MLPLAEDTVKPAVSLLTVHALAVQAIVDMNIVHYFNSLIMKLLFLHYINTAMSIGMGGA
jgi:hypothetical protein